jgi:putative transcriptional regulator
MLRRIDRLSQVSDSIRRALEEALAYTQNPADRCQNAPDRSQYRVTAPQLVDVRAIREKLGLTLDEFAAQFGFSAAAVNQWEQGPNQPEGPARAYLLVIDRAPKAVQRALRIG